jgi:hypothetical protein
LLLSFCAGSHLVQDEEEEEDVLQDGGYGAEEPAAVPKTKRLKKDPNAPKKPLNAYMLYVTHRHRELRESDPPVPAGSSSKQVADEWNAMGEAERAPFVAMYNADKARFQREKDALAAKKGAPKKKQKKDPDAPKRPVNAYMLYLNKRRLELKEADPDSVAPVQKKITEEWHAMSAAEQAPFQAMFEANRERYQGEQAAYKAAKASETGGKKRERVRKRQAWCHLLSLCRTGRGIGRGGRRRGAD